MIIPQRANLSLYDERILVFVKGKFQLKNPFARFGNISVVKDTRVFMRIVTYIMP